MKRLVCVQNELAETKIHQLEAKFRGRGIRLFLEGLKRCDRIRLPAFCLIQAIILITATWANQVLYPTLLQMVIQKPVLIPSSQDMIFSSTGKMHLMVVTNFLHLTAWKVLQKQRNFRMKQQNCCV